MILQALMACIVLLIVALFKFTSVTIDEAYYLFCFKNLELIQQKTRHAVNEYLILDLNASEWQFQQVGLCDLIMQGHKRKFPIFKLDLCSQLPKLCDQIN